MIFNHRSAGFTLVELLVVTGIIGVISTLVLLNIDASRARARDAKRKADLISVHLALYQFYVMNGRMPLNYVPGSGQCDGSAAYNSSMQELVGAGLLESIPRTPNDVGLYCYYDYGPENDIGALVTTYLESGTLNTGALPPAPQCLPWASGTNWCDQSVNRYYCLCAPY